MLALLLMLGSKGRETSEAQLRIPMAVNRGCQRCSGTKKAGAPRGI